MTMRGFFFHRLGLPLLAILLVAAAGPLVLLSGCTEQSSQDPLNKLFPSRSGTFFAAKPDYTPLRKQIEDYISTKNAKYGIYFKDLTSGATFGINENTPMKAASTNKVLTVLYLNQRIVDGKLNWWNRVTYHSATDYNSEGGILQVDAEEGQSYSLRVLANLSITLSDNIAHKMLIRYLGLENIARYMESLGGQVVYPDGQNVTTARDMGIYMQAVLDFAKKYPEPGNRLIDDLANTIWDFGLPGLIPDKVMVAHKEGQIYAVANDVGIVFGSRPFILAILSDGIPDINKGFSYLAEISRMIYDYQQKLGS